MGGFRPSFEEKSITVNRIIGCLIAVLFVISLSGQGLFESALENEDGSLPGNSSLGGFVRSAMYIGNTAKEDNTYLQSIVHAFAVVSHHADA